jgi:hypothetical protein
MRAALVSGDGDRIVAAMAGVNLEGWAQQVGSGLIAAIENGSEGVRPIARHCADVLRGRRRDGDEELAEDLESALDPDSNGLRLPALLVDLDEVADLLDSGNGDGGWIDLNNGDTWNRDMLDAFDEFDEHRPDFDDDSGRWLAVPSLGGRAAYRDMQDFISAVTDPTASERLTVAIEGRGAFRRFKDALRSYPDLEDDWYRFSDERRHGRARSWLAHAGYRPRQRAYSAPT